jgi:hypothetical protein
MWITVSSNGSAGMSVERLHSVDNHQARSRMLTWMNFYCVSRYTKPALPEEGGELDDVKHERRGQERPPHACRLLPAKERREKSNRSQ